MNFEDIRKRLLFPDPAVRRRIVSKLLHVILQKKPSNLQISSSTPQIPELLLLWEICGNDEVTLSVTSMEGICFLVMNGHMQLDHAINRFISIISSNGHPAMSINGITRLLINQQKNSPESNFFNYSTHPLIRLMESEVVQEKPELWHFLYENLIDAITNNGRSGFSAVRHVLDYIFLSPLFSSDVIMVKTKLLEKLLFKANEQRDEVLNYLLQILPWLQMKTSHHAAFASHMLSSIIQHVVPLSKRHNISINYETIIFAALVISNCCLQHGFSCSSLFDTLEDFCGYHEPKDISNEVNLILISFSLCEVSELTALRLISLSNLLLEKNCPSKIVTSMLTAQVVQLMSESKPVSLHHNKKSKFVVSAFLQKLQDCPLRISQNSGKQNHNLINVGLLEAFSSLSGQSVNCARFIQHLNALNDMELINWLKSVKETILQCETFSRFHFLVVSGLLFVNNGKYDYLNACLEVLEVMCEKQQALSTKVFALLLYRHSQVDSPECQLLLVEYLPKTAVHMYAVAPVLNVILMMGRHAELKSQAIKLMLELWKKQNRCFPHLHKLLNEKDCTVNQESGVCEVLAAQATAINYLCTKFPETYGEQLLGDLSGIINVSNEVGSTPAAVLALLGVQSLCKNKIIDLRSTWKALSPKLKDNRPDIIICIIHLLGLTPELEVNSLQYEKFMKESASHLLSIVSSEKSSPSVVAAAYEALAAFSLDCYTLQQLPKMAKINLTIPKSMTITPFDLGKSPEDILDYIPGYCFVDLLRNIESSTILKGYGSYIQSLISQELKNMPQVVYTSVRYSGRKSRQNKILDMVPRILFQTFEKKSLMCFQKNLAVGVLISYEPPLEFNKDGKPLKKSIMAQGDYYLRVLAQLLDHVNLDHVEWQRCVLLLPAWSSFIERAFLSIEESRRISAPESINFTWLWARDQLFHTIEKAAKNTSTCAANAVLAISGLVKALEKYYRNLNGESRSIDANDEKCMEHEAFQSMCTDSILYILDPISRPPINKISWMTMHLPRESTSSGSLIKGCAAVSLCNLLPVMKHLFIDKIPKILKVLENSVMAQSPILSLYSGIGLGMFVQVLVQDGYFIRADDQANSLLKIGENLAKYCKTEEANGGSYLALTLVHVALSKMGNGEFLTWTKETSFTFYEKLTTASPNSNEFEFLSICTCCMVIDSVLANQIPIKQMESLMSWLKEQQEKRPQCSSTSVSLSVLVEALISLGCVNAMEYSKKLQKSLLNTVSSKKSPTLHRIAAMNGLCALFSRGQGLVQINQSCVNRESELKDFITVLLQYLDSDQNPSLQGISCWELGRMYHIYNEQQSEASLLLTNYSYLGERSVLKPLSLFIEESSSQNNDIYMPQLLLSVRALSEQTSKPLPPLNWAVFLTPLLQKIDEFELIEYTLKIAMHQSSSSTSAKLLFATYITPPIIHTLPANCLKMLLRNIFVISNSVPIDKLMVFLQTIFLSDPKLYMKERDVAFQGILDFMSCSTRKNEAMAIIQDILLNILKDLKTDFEQFPTVCNIIACLSHESQEAMFCALKNDHHISSVVHIMCHLLKIGNRPLTTIKQCIEIGHNGDEKDKMVIASTLLDCITICNKRSEHDLIPILMETIGWMKVLLSSPSSQKTESIERDITFLFDISVILIIGSASYVSSYTLWPKEIITHKTLVQHLCTAIATLADTYSKEESLNKLLDWLLILRNSLQIHQNDKPFIVAAICALRQSKLFQKSSVWMEIIDLDNVSIQF